MAGWIVELEKDVWIAPWDGDPGRTLRRKSARMYPTIESAQRALNKARSFPGRLFEKARIIEVSNERL